MGNPESLQQHEAAGRYFTAMNLQSFVREAGEGTPVVLMHGVPASCYLYRKVLPELAKRGLRGVAFDLPGLGLADRPEDFDYRWTHLGRFSAAAVDALGLEEFHLVVHDIGGPVGFELAAAMPDQVRSLTILNTMIYAAGFQKPWSMRPFAIPVLGELWLAGMIKPAFRMLMRMQGIYQHDQVSNSEIDTYVDLLKRGDKGRAFLRMMRCFETTQEKEEKYLAVVKNPRYPVQVVWGEKDPALQVDRHGELALQATGLKALQRLPGRHFLQEDNAAEIAEAVQRIAQAA